MSPSEPGPAPGPGDGDRPAPDGLTALPVTFRPTRTRVILLSCGAALLVTLTVIALLLPSLGGGERASFVCTGLLCLGVLALLSRPRVDADRTGITVVNLTTVRRLEWAEVVRVGLRPGDPWVQLDLADGTQLPAMGIQPGLARDRAVADARALRDLAEHYGSSPSAG